MSRGHPRVLLVGAIAALLCAACAGAPPPLAPGPSIGPAGAAVVYAALGASETAGTGLNDLALRDRYAWPQLFFNEVLGRAGTYYNFAVPGITTSDALVSEVPAALALHPDLVTVFFNLDDLVRGVSPTTFGANLDTIVHTMRQGGRARVLVGNAPSIDNLPALRACEGLPAGSATCPLPPGVAVPPLAVIDAAVAAYDAAITAVVAREGATLVDLLPYSNDLLTHPEDVAPDGLHPSALGDRRIAALFATAYRS